MTREGLTYDRKALAIVTGKTADWEDLARHAVAFAAARSGIRQSQGHPLPPGDPDRLRPSQKIAPAQPLIAPIPCI